MFNIFFVKEIGLSVLILHWDNTYCWILTLHQPVLSIIQLLHAVTGSMAFCTLEGENCTRGEAEGAISPRGCTKPMDPSHSVLQLLCYSSSGSSVVIFKHYYDEVGILF